MPRPIKNNADYFPHSAYLRGDTNLMYLQSKFGNVGYALYLKFMEKLCSSKNHRIEWNEISKSVISKDFGIEMEVLEKFVKEAQICKALTLDDQYLFSELLNELLEPLYNTRKRQRKDPE